MEKGPYASPQPPPPTPHGRSARLQLLCEHQVPGGTPGVREGRIAAKPHTSGTRHAAHSGWHIHNHLRSQDTLLAGAREVKSPLLTPYARKAGRELPTPGAAWGSRASKACLLTGTVPEGSEGLGLREAGPPHARGPEGRNAPALATQR